MTTTKRVDIHLRGASGPLRAGVRWSGTDDTRLLLHFDGAPDGLGPHAVALSPELDAARPGALDDAAAALGWAADHAAELGAAPARLVVAGRGAGAAIAAGLALLARDEGWPPLERQILVRPRLPEGFAPDLAGVADATVVTGPDDDGRAYAGRLRAAGVPVDQIPADEGSAR
ncbi:alpha/beta hydrolase fold domain-containing protein [Actinomadura citrea]|uniref:Acetyl esterase/lipase n=1 Tax=Actinomadura citrea TaxID=46158 RepID=A0A7Y9G6I0_9ACTN|nr:alpha/beta hydrolase fold domain-containing protein [Actinomadura citrea]NYE10651.1 acetyl esterase/lipase [Actinomadura citrea]